MFDPKTYEEPVEAPIESEARRNLRELSRLLRHPEEWPRWEWDFSDISNNRAASAENIGEASGCGTAGCALGLWDAHRERYGAYIKDFTDAMADADRERVFISSQDYGVTRISDVTPEMVADKIDQYLRDNPGV